MTIEELQLAPVAARAARLLKEKHPSVVFTSGRRNLTAQASAMASNIIGSHNRKWISQTYASSAASRALQSWVDAHPQRITQAAIAAGLLETLRALSPEVAGQISKHLSGLAFDVQPVAGAAGEAIKATMRNLPGLKKFLDHEGGLVRWHVQF